MANYLVIRLTPTSPVDGFTFATYLEGLTINVYPANSPSGTPSLGSASYLTPLILIQEPGVDGSYIICETQPTLDATTYVSKNNYGDFLDFASTKGIPVGSTLFHGFAQDLFAPGTIVTAVTQNKVTLNQALPNFVPANSFASFIWYFALSGSAGSPWSTFPPALVLPGTMAKAAAKGATVLELTSTDGIAFGMSVSTSLAGVIDTDTTVYAADATSVTLSKPILKALPKDTSISFSYPLGSGILQHVEKITDFFYIPAAVATAIIELNSPPSLLNITVNAQRGTGSTAEQIPVDDAYYNVLVDSSSSLPTTPDDYQAIQPEFTSLYISLPPPPRNDNGFSVTLPSNGTAPKFDELFKAMQNVLAHDPAFSSAQSKTANAAAKGATVLDLASTAGIAYGMSVSAQVAGVIDTDTTVSEVGSTSVTLSKPILLALPKDTPVNFTYLFDNLTTDQYRQIAYDIVWSQQNILPAPPDPLESLYTNPPNTGGSGNDGNGNNDEQDRQKFEGTLNSFYSTKKAAAERLTKYVAAVSTAIYCEKKSLAAAAAVLEFPVDPVDPSTQPAVAPAQVQSELLLQGLSSSGINFGVPAAFFYALGANLDKSTSGDHRYQIATGDTIERLLQEIGAAVDAGVIQDAEQFSSSGAPTGKINSAQAARRLVALYGSGSSAVGVAVGLLNETNRGGFTAFVNFGLGIDRVIKDLMPR